MIKDNSVMSWYNYKTEEYETIETPKDFSNYIPQLPAAQGLYSCYIAMGDNPIDAARKVLESCIPTNISTKA